MNNLIGANFDRLFKSKIFRFALLAVAAFTLFTVNMECTVALQNNSDKGFEEVAFRMLPYFGIFIACYLSIFLGTDYSDMTVRNKLISGHSRREVYGANLFVCCAASLILFAVWAAIAFCVSAAYYGTASVNATVLGKLSAGIFTVLSLTSIFAALAQTAGGRREAVVAAIILALVIVLMGSYFYNALCEPQTIAEGVYISAEEGVVIGPEKPNPAYVGGNMRAVYQAMLIVVPAGQQILIACEKIENPVTMIAASLAICLLVTAAGYMIFAKKDLK